MPRWLGHAGGNLAEIVYLLGAGANQSVEDWHGLRPPLATNFFQAALRCDKYSGDHYSERIRPVYEYIDQYWRKTKSQLQTDPFDLEEVFTLLEQQRAEAEWQQDGEQFRRLATTEFLLQSFLAEFLAEFEYHAVTSETMRRFGAILYGEKPTILTFNYDCILERIIESAFGVRSEIPAAFRGRPNERGEVTDEEIPYSHYNWNRPLAYGVEFAEVELQRAGLGTYVDGARFYGHPQNMLYPWPVLKLHGSLNWFRYLPIRKYPVVGGPEPQLSEERRRGVVLIRGHWWFAEPPDRDGWLLDPLLITPTLDKQRFLRQPIFIELWNRARAELSSCKRLVIIGYSFPPTDFSTKRLFLEAFKDNSPQELVVVNPDMSVVPIVKELSHFDRPVVVCRDLEEYVALYARRTAAHSAASRRRFPMEFREGQRVRVVQRGSIQVGGTTLTDNVFDGVVIVRKNADGTYGVRGIIKTAETDVIDIPAEWIEPLE